ncbi:GAF domain-containing protein [Chitinimonas sp.]|uniref:GAF domain-containing protein n=1 Tax=Chitinimonas sp. TaxID=1934313 RepID=UPI0035B0287C
MIPIDTLRACLLLPAQLASLGGQGAITIRQARLHFVDQHHLALPAQADAPGRLSALLLHPHTAARYRLTLSLSGQQCDGPVVAALRARHNAISTSQGRGQAMLAAADIYHLDHAEALPGSPLASDIAPGSGLRALRHLSDALANTEDLAQVLDLTLDTLADMLAVEQAMILFSDESGRWLYTVASRGYPVSGVGSEVMMGDGIIGAAARFLSPVHFSCRYSAGLAANAQAGSSRDPEIPLPGLPAPQSQLAVPIRAGDWLAGVLYVESRQARRFSHHDEDALSAIGAILGMVMRPLLRPVDIALPDLLPPNQVVSQGSAVEIRYFATTQSVFIGDDYLVKGVAGAVLWLLLNDYQQLGRTDFSNRELRLDPRLRLPEIGDNLETRLLLLQRRLSERCSWLGLEKLGRGRLRLRLEQPYRLVDVENESLSADLAVR